MYPPYTWSQHAALVRQTMRMSMAANAVIAQRLFGKDRNDPIEAWRMMAEKPLAFSNAAFAGWVAASKGGAPAAVARAAMLPISKKVQQNKRRLGR